jgi:hypothetical protein
MDRLRTCRMQRAIKQSQEYMVQALNAWVLAQSKRIFTQALICTYLVQDMCRICRAHSWFYSVCPLWVAPSFCTAEVCEGACRVCSSLFPNIFPLSSLPLALPATPYHALSPPLPPSRLAWPGSRRRSQRSLQLRCFPVHRPAHWKRWRGYTYHVVLRRIW